MALHQSAPQPLASDAQARLRRCTYRRVSAVRASKRELPIYDVACLFPARTAPVPLGDLISAAPICDSCTARGIFRADED